MSELITIGEPLVVFASTEPDVSVQDSINFNKGIGGAELNVAIGTRRLNHSVSYLGAVGADPQGRFIIDQIQRKQINTNYLYESIKYMTGYQMKQLVSHGDPKVYNFRKDSAASHITPANLSSLDLKNVKFAHLTGILPATSSDALATCLFLAKKANQEHITLTFDPNLRPALWENKAKMIKTINYLASFANIVLPGQSEGKILTGSDDPDDIADFYLKNEQTQAVFVKIGSKGSFVKVKGHEGDFIPGFKVNKVVDTVGAGDGYALGVITALLENESYQAAARRGNAIGAMQVQVRGDNDGYPTRDKLRKFFTDYGVEV